MSNPSSQILDRRTILTALALCAVVAITAYLCLAFAREQGRIAPIWLTNAWVVAVLLRSPTARWPVLALAGAAGALMANLWVHDPPVIAAGLAACNALEGLACAWLVRWRCGGIFNIGRGKHLMTFVAAAVIASIGSAVAAAVLLRIVDDANILRGLVAWWVADALGLLTLAPSLLAMTQKNLAKPVWRETWTLAVLAAVTIAVFFVTRYPMLFLISAALTLPTWRMGLPGAVASFAIVAVVGVAAALTGHGPLMIADSADQIVGLQIFLAISFLTSIPLAVARDESERLKGRLRTALAEARSARAAAEQAAVVKTEFLANMSHELRTPLTSVVGFTRLASEQPDLPPISRDYIDRVAEASRALLCAVNDILDFSKLEAGQVSFRPEPVVFADLTRGALDLFAPQAGAKDLTLRLEDHTPAGLVIAVDPDRLRQVLLNLVGNAVKFTEAGEIVLQADYAPAAARLSIRVTDTGPGIPADRLDRLFKRFSQVDGSLTRGHGGTGLGLAICKGVVEAMGGEIGVASTPGEGSTFWFSVPAPLAEARISEPTATDAQGLAPGVRLLVTDDHPANRDLVQLFLAAMGVEVCEAADGASAVALAAHQPFDIILMDLRMPGLDGAGALRRIRSSPGPNQTTPILAFTADAECVLEDRLREQGFAGAVPKPVDPGQLIAAIVAALNPADDGRGDGAALSAA